MRKFRMSILLSSLVALLLTSCQGNGEGAQEKPAKKINFPKIEGCTMSFLCLTQEKNRTFAPGAEARINLGLRNDGANHFLCYEWMMEEDYNVNIYYSPCDAKSDVSAQNFQWIKESPEIKEPVKRMPLDLAPRNTALIYKELKFVKAIPATIKEPKYFAVYAELNLKSFAAKTEVFRIKVDPAKKELPPQPVLEKK